MADFENQQMSGLQIFIATHDYLLTHMLSLYSEYKEHTGVCVRFFGLHKEEGCIVVEESDTLAAIQNNPILEEYAAFYDLEQKYMSSYERYQFQLSRCQLGGCQVQ